MAAPPRDGQTARAQFLPWTFPRCKTQSRHARTASMTSVPRRAIERIARFSGGAGRRIATSADLVVDRGQGSHIYDSNGSAYLDVISGYGVASLGHCDPRWVQAVTSQAQRLAVTPLHTRGLADYLTALSAVLPAPLAAVALFTTGAEAVEAALRLTQTSCPRPHVLAFDTGFHGKTAGLRYAGDSTSSEARALRPVWMKTAAFPTCEHHDAVDYSRCAESAADTLRQIASRDDLDDVGTVLVEPILGTAGNLPPEKAFLAGLRELCHERGWLLVFDESITGFGRTGRLFAHEYFGVRPDVLILGKGLGGGFPLSAVCASRALWEGSAYRTPSATSSTHGGNPLACAAGLATLEIVADEAFLAEVRDTAVHAAERLRDLANTSQQVVRPRGVGLMLGFDLIDPDSGELATPEMCASIFRACRDHGVLALVDIPRVRLSPPLTITLGEIDRLFDVLGQVLA
jgi:4-aminobutyrate aminotransferase-like enzyme